MRFEQTFTVPSEPDRTFAALTDVPLVASCMPGIELADGGDGRRHAGTLRAKLGPISLTYRGEAWFEEVDEAARTFRLVAAATEAGGAGNAGATVTAAVVPDDAGSRVELGVDLQIAGRPAQFGRGLIVDVSRQMTDQFAGQLAARLSPDASAAPTAAERAATAPPEALSAWSLVPARLRYTVVAILAFVVGVLMGIAIGRRTAARSGAAEPRQGTGSAWRTPSAPAWQGAAGRGAPGRVDGSAGKPAAAAGVAGPTPDHGGT